MEELHTDNHFTYLNEKGKEISKEEYEKNNLEFIEKVNDEARVNREKALKELSKATGVDVETLRYL